MMDFLGHLLIVGGYNGRYDISVYRIRYDTGFIMPGLFEKYYDYLAGFFFRRGVSFDVFHLVLTALSLGIIVYIISRITDKTAFVLGLMFGYSMIENALQLQWLAATAAIVYALYYFYKRIYTIKPRIQHYLVFILLILLAMEFHFAAVFFLVLLVMKIIPKKYYWEICVFGSIILFFLLNPLLTFFLQYIPSLSEYTGQHRSIFVILAFSLWTVVGIYLIEKNCNFLLKMKLENKGFISFVKDTSLLMLFVIPFFTVSTIMDRIFHIWFVFYFCALSFYPANRISNLAQPSLIVYNWTSFILFYAILAKYSNGLMLINEVTTHNFFWGS